MICDFEKQVLEIFSFYLIFSSHNFYYDPICRCLVWLTSHQIARHSVKSILHSTCHFYYIGIFFFKIYIIHLVQQHYVWIANGFDDYQVEFLEFGISEIMRLRFETILWLWGRELLIDKVMLLKKYIKRAQVTNVAFGGAFV